MASKYKKIFKYLLFSCFLVFLFTLSEERSDESRGFLILSRAEVFSFFSIPAAKADPMPTIESPFDNLQVKIPTVTFSDAKPCPAPNANKYCFYWIGEYVTGLYRFAIGIAGILAAFSLVMGGFAWIMAGGSPDKVKQAKTYIGAAITGMILISASYLILNTLNEQFTILAPIGIEPAKLIVKEDPNWRYSKCKFEASGMVPAGKTKVDESICEAKGVKKQYAGETKEYCYCEAQGNPGCFWKTSCDATKETADASGSNCNSTEIQTNKKCCCQKEQFSNSKACEETSGLIKDGKILDYTQVRTQRAMPPACDAYDETFKIYGKQYGVEPMILKAIASQESACTANATGYTREAFGLMQLKPSTANKYLSIIPTAQRPAVIDETWLKNNPELSIMLAARYISDEGSGLSEPDIFAGYNSGYGTEKNPSTGKKGGLAPSSDCPGVKAYQCCINPDELEQTQDYVLKCEEYLNGCVDDRDCYSNILIN